MELDELHVLDLGAGAPCERDAVAGRNVGIASVEIHLPAAPGRKDGVRRTDGVYLVGRLVQDVCAHASVGPLQPQSLRRDEVYHDRVFAHVDFRVAPQRANHGGLALLPGDVASVENAAHGMPALASEIPRAVFLLRETHAAVDQIAYARRRLGNDPAHDVLVAKARAGDLRVAHVLLE